MAENIVKPKEQIRIRTEAWYDMVAKQTVITQRIREGFSGNVQEFPGLGLRCWSASSVLSSLT